MPDPTTLLLIRHGQTDWIAKGVAGRLPGVHLNAEGRDQAARLAGRCRALPIAVVYSSPLERALETAVPLAEAFGLEVRPCPEAVELDFGEWAGHGDVIRAAIAYCLGVPLDLFLRIEIRPALVSSVRFSDESLLVLGVNDTGELYT